MLCGFYHWTSWPYFLEGAYEGGCTVGSQGGKEAEAMLCNALNNLHGSVNGIIDGSNPFEWLALGWLLS